MEMSCLACFWDASRSQITALCQLHSSCVDLTAKNRWPFASCLFCASPVICPFSACPGAQEHFSDRHLKSLILSPMALKLKQFCTLSETTFWSHFCVRLSEEKLLFINLKSILSIIDSCFSY